MLKVDPGSIIISKLLAKILSNNSGRNHFADLPCLLYSFTAAIISVVNHAEWRNRGRKSGGERGQGAGMSEEERRGGGVEGERKNEEGEGWG